MEEGQERGKLSGKSAIGALVLVGLLLLGGYLVYTFDLIGAFKAYLQNSIHPLFFLALMAILPVLGAPVNPFLVLVGMKFGIGAGILLSAVIMSFHMAATYYLVHSLLRDRIYRLLQRFRVSLPTLIRNYSTSQAVIFMLVPGVPYAVKSNVLALAGFSFLPYMAINWSTQYGRGILLIVLGGAAVEMELTILGVALLLLLAGYLLQRYVRKRLWKRPPG